MPDLKLNSVENFLEYLLKEKNYSMYSIKSYRVDLRQFCEFLNQYYGRITHNFSSIDKTTIKHFLGYLFERGITSRSVARKLASVKSFFKYLVKVEEIKSNPARGVKSPKFKKSLPDFLEEDVMNRIMNAPGLKTWQDLCDRAILELFYSTGMRLSELVRLSIKDVKQKENIIKVLGKGNKERIIPVGDTAIRVINHYLKARNKEMGFYTSHDPLFISSRNRRISPRTIQNRLKKYFEEIAIGMKFHPHLIRHTFATHMLNRGADIRAVKDLLGHVSLSSTQIYTHLNVDQMKKIYQQSHPHA